MNFPSTFHSFSSTFPKPFSFFFTNRFPLRSNYPSSNQPFQSLQGSPSLYFRSVQHVPFLQPAVPSPTGPPPPLQIPLAPANLSFPSRFPPLSISPPFNNAFPFLTGFPNLLFPSPNQPFHFQHVPPPSIFFSPSNRPVLS